jgi:Zn-finger protein
MNLWPKPTPCDFCQSPVYQIELILGRAKKYRDGALGPTVLICDNCSLIIKRLDDIKHSLRSPAYRQLIKQWWKIIPVNNDSSEQLRARSEVIQRLSWRTMPPHPEYK